MKKVYIFITLVLLLVLYAMTDSVKTTMAAVNLNIDKNLEKIDVQSPKVNKPVLMRNQEKGLLEATSSSKGVKGIEIEETSDVFNSHLKTQGFNSFEEYENSMIKGIKDRAKLHQKELKALEKKEK
jgi:hypothetical protein